MTADGETHALPDPFFVIATQNPIEQEGTFVLPEAQRDRFMIKTAMGYPNRAGERELLDRRAERTTKEPGVSAVASESAVREIQSTVERVDVDSRLRDYIVEVCRATRADSRVETGVSPRGVQRLFEVSRARAMLHGREYVVPEDVKALAHPVLDHRIVLTSDARIRETEASSVVDSVLSSTEVPAMNAN